MPWGHFINPWCISLQYHVQVSELMKEKLPNWESLEKGSMEQLLDKKKLSQIGLISLGKWLLKRDLKKACKVLRGMENVTSK